MTGPGFSGTLDDLARSCFEQEMREAGSEPWIAVFAGTVILGAVLSIMTTPLAAFPLVAAGAIGWICGRRIQVSSRLRSYREGDTEALQSVHRFAVGRFREAIESHRAKTLGSDTEWGRARESLTRALDQAGRSVAYWKARVEQSPDNELARGQLEVANELRAKLRLALRKLNRRADVLLNFYNECDARLAMMNRYNRDMEETRRLEELSGRADMVIAGAQGALAAIGQDFVREAQAVGRALSGLAEVQIKSLAGEAPLDNIEYLADRVIENSESEERAIGALEEVWEERERELEV